MTLPTELEVWPWVTRRGNFRKFGHVFFRYASGQTDRHTDMLIAILHFTFLLGRSKK